jgi:hypothetical protein
MALASGAYMPLLPPIQDWFGPTSRIPHLKGEMWDTQTC